MKQYIISFFAFMAIFVLSGCGGGSDNISNQGNVPTSSTAISIDLPLMGINGKSFTVNNILITKNIDSGYKVGLNDFTITANNCNVVSFTPSSSSLRLDGDIGSTVRLSISGMFDQNCTSTDYVFSTKATSTKDGKNDVRMYNALSESSPPPINAFFNATTPLEIIGVNTSYAIKVQILEHGNVASGQIVTMKPFDNIYGSVTEYTAITAADGYAIFNYISPNTLPVAGTMTTFELVNENNGTIIYQDIVLNFNDQGIPFDYNLSNERTPVAITSGGQIETISVYVVDSATNVGVSGKDVSISTITTGFGSIVNASTVTTDSTGKAEFTYEAPIDITAIDGQTTSATLSFTEDGVTITKNVILTFDNVVIPTEYAIANENNITVNYASESKEIALQLLKNGVPQAGETVIAKSIPSIYGRIENVSVVTGADGYARFTYIAANPLVDTVGQPLQLIYMDVNGAVVSKTVSITIMSLTTQPAYNLTNVTTPLIVNYDNELKSISVDVVNQSNVGIEGIDVNISVVNGIQYGAIISASTTKSDSSGRALFSYKAPADVSMINGQSTVLTLSMETNGVVITRDVTLEFNKIDTNITVPIVVIANNFKEMNLTQNSQNVQMEIQVFKQGTNTPYTSGNVAVSLPDEVLTGTDVGSFSEYSVPVGPNGKAVFNYTGPQDLQTLIDNGDMNATFKFFHEENPTQQETITVIYDLQAGYIPANYVLSTSSSDGNQTMGLNLLKSFTLYLKDDQGTLVDDTAINALTITSQNTLVGKLVDATNSGNNVATLTFTGADAINSKSFSVQTYTLSGLLPIEITVGFTDGNGDSKSLTITMNIVVLSGPPTALSISYAGVEVNATTAKYIEKFAVTVTDTYNNPVNTRPYIATGAIVEYSVDGFSATGNRTTTSPRLWHGINDSRGELEALGSTAQFTTIVDTFNWIDINNDRLVVFGDGFAYEAFGKWDLDSVSNQLLGLKDNYFGTTRSNVLFAAGHNNRQDLCSVDARQYVGNMKAKNYQLDQDGHAFIEFEYDYHLTGKDIMVWVNLTGFQADNGNTGRIGDAKKHTLRGAGFVSPEAYSLPVGGSGIFRFTVEHENAPEVYRNGHFSTATEGSCTVVGIVDYSNMHDARECTNTKGYIYLDVRNDTAEVCTVQLSDGSIVVTPEFNGVSSF